MIASCLVAASVVLFSYYTVKIYLLRSRYSHIPGPGTKGIFGFYLGNVLDLRKTVHKDKKIADDLILEWFFFNY